MGCILSLLGLIVKCAKIVAKAVIWFAKTIVKLIFKCGLGLPLIATVAFVIAWQLDYITQGTWQFDACVIGLAILTVVCAVFKLTRKDKNDKR